MYRPFALTLLLSLPLLSQAATITPGQKLPPLRIAELGECVIKGDDTAFEPWQSSQLLGRVQVVEYMAARAGIDKVQQKLYAAIKAAQLPTDRFAVAKLVNADDALIGTSGLVAPEVRKNKKGLRDETLVVDADGVGLKSWELKPKSSAIAIVDASGTVLFFKEGALSDEEITLALALIRQQLK